VSDGEQQQEQEQGQGQGEQEEKSDFKKQEKDAEQEVADLEDDPPQDLEDWPDGPAKYKTLGGPDSASGYDEGPTANLGASNVRYHEDGSITVDGEEVDNPDEYKGDPIPGGPTDPNSQPMPGDKSMGEGTADEDGEGAEANESKSKGKDENGEARESDETEASSDRES